MVDYSKWKNIEISDDEDDTHPNIDTPSLFRWRHQARVERMQEKEKEKKKLDDEKKKYDERLAAVKKTLAEAERCEDERKKADLKAGAGLKMKELQGEMEKFNLKVKEVEKKEKLEPWNVDTISQAGFDKSLINKDEKRKVDTMTDEEKAEEMTEFLKANKAKVKEFGMFRKFEDSRKFMQENLHLACEHSANYLVLWCVELEMEGKNTLMRHVAHQTVCLQFILELAKQLDRDPRACVSAFFNRIQLAKDEYTHFFEDEVSSYISRIEKRAKDKLKEAEEEEAALRKEAEEEERKARLGPGGLDPLEVLETLPEELKACFESQDIGQLKACIKAMEPKDAAYHMKRCVASGLWVPEGGAGLPEGEAAAPTDPNTGLVDRGKEGEEEEEDDLD